MLSRIRILAIALTSRLECESRRNGRTRRNASTVSNKGRILCSCGNLGLFFQDYDEQYWPEIVSIVASYTNGYSKKVPLTLEESTVLLAKSPEKEKT